MNVFDSLCLPRKPGKPGRPRKEGGVEAPPNPRYSEDLRERIASNSFVFKTKEGSIGFSWKTHGPRRGSAPGFKTGMDDLAEVCQIIQDLAKDPAWVKAKLEESEAYFASLKK